MLLFAATDRRIAADKGRVDSDVNSLHDTLADACFVVLERKLKPTISSLKKMVDLIRLKMVSSFVIAVTSKFILAKLVTGVLS